MRSSKVSLATLAMASILPWVAASVSSADRVKVLLDPPPLPSGGSGVEVAPAGKPRWVQLHDFVRGEAPPLRRSDPDGPLDPPFPTPTSPPNIAFDGIISTGTLVPPDTHIAVGPGLGNAGRVIMVTNETVGVWDKTGAPVASRALSNMFTGVGPFAFDPKILFDQHSGRFFIVCLRGFNSTESEIHIAVSSSGTPNNLSADWTFLVGSGLTNIGGSDTWSDYPGIGADNLSLFTTFNLFDDTPAFRGVKVRIFDKVALLAGIYTFVDLNYDDDVTIVRTTQPAHVYGATTNGGFYLISRIGSSTYRLFHITGHPAAPVATTNTFAWSGGTFPSDGGADQCTVANPDVATLSSRIQNAIHRNGHIWCTLASDPDNDGQVEVVWQDILDNSYPTNVPTVFQSGFIDGTGTDPWTYMPSINVNAAGDAAIVYTQSSTVECPNMYYVSRFSIDAPGTFQAPVLAKTSAGFYDSFYPFTPDRWGDYSAVVIDPTDDCFWVAQEFVYLSGVGSSLWGTHIASFCPQCEPNELKKLLAFVGAPGDFFGVSVSISGDVAVVGASHVFNGGPGSAYVYRFDGTTWLPEQQLFASNGAAGDEFGISVAISGDVAIVGARRGDDANGVETGSAYVYRFVANNWAQEGPKLLAPAGAAGDFFGYSVAIRGDVAIVGAYRDDDGGFNSGSAYVYRFDGNNMWLQEGPKLLASDGVALDEFGLSVAISGDVAIVGAYHHDEGGAPNSGSAYIYRFDGINTWGQEQKLFASDGAAQDEFGYSVAISGDAVIVGAPLQNDPGTDFGSAYVYRFDVNNMMWGQEGPKLLASDGDAFDHFGVSVAISGDAAIVGVLFDDDNGFNSGSAYVYRFDGIGMWGQEQKLLASDGAVNDVFGVSVAISGDAAIVGALAHGDNGSNSGAAYVFDCFGADCNANCRGDACDIAAGTSQDINNNGIPDECEEVPMCPWDLDGSGSVGASDLLALLASWGPCKGCPADFDGNGNVGASDLLALLANWGPCQKK